MNLFDMKTLKLNNLVVYQFISFPIRSNMFIIFQKNNALLIDPHYSLEALNLLELNNVNEITIILTHEHPDHTSGVNFFREKYQSLLICNEICAQRIAIKRNNQPTIILMKLMEEDKKNKTNLVQRYKEKNPPYICFADVVFKSEKTFNWFNSLIKLTSTPGHSPGSITIEYDKKLLFTGDYLIKDTPVIARFKDSSIQDLKNITIPYFEKINHELVILPGHGNAYIYKNSEVDPLEWLRT